MTVHIRTHVSSSAWQCRLVQMESAPALAKEVHTILVEVARELIGHCAAGRIDVPLPAIFRLGPYVHASLLNVLCTR